MKNSAVKTLFAAALLILCSARFATTSAMAEPSAPQGKLLAQAPGTVTETYTINQSTVKHTKVTWLPQPPMITVELYEGDNPKPSNAIGFMFAKGTTLPGPALTLDNVQDLWLSHYKGNSRQDTPIGSNGHAEVLKHLQAFHAEMRPGGAVQFAVKSDYLVTPTPSMKMNGIQWHIDLKGTVKLP